MKFFYSFLIIFFSALMWLLPVMDATQHFLVQQRTDTFIISTGVGTTTANIALHSQIYEDDTTTLTLSSTIGEQPTWTSYNGTTHALALANLTGNVTRIVSATYKAVGPTLQSIPAAVSVFQNVVPFIYYTIFSVLPIGAMVMMFMKR